MSVSLFPTRKSEESLLDCSNMAWHQIVESAHPLVPLWDGCHGAAEYTPEQLRAMAKLMPTKFSTYGFSEALEELAKRGGAFLY